MLSALHIMASLTGSSEDQQQEEQTDNEVKDIEDKKESEKEAKVHNESQNELTAKETAEESITQKENSEQQEQIETSVNVDQTQVKQNGIKEEQESEQQAEKQETDKQSEEDDKNDDIEVNDIIDGIVRNILVNKTVSQQSSEMPEKNEAIPQSPTLQRATCRYRWAQTIPTDSSDVYFFLSTNKDDGVKLTWMESASCYYSEELDIPIGIYNGELMVDDKRYPIEDINIKHYTFEADIFVKDDDTNNNILEEEVNQQISDTALADYQTTKMEDGSESPIHLSNKYEELVRQQLSQKALELDVEDRLSRSQKSDHSSGRHTPIGDVAIETYQDGDSDLLRSGNRSFNKDSLENSLVEDEVERSSVVRSVNSSVRGRQTPQDLIQDIVENDLRRTPVKSPGSSARQTPSQIDVMAEILGSEQRATPLRSAENSLNGSRIHTPVRSKSGDELRSPIGSVNNSVHSSARHTPLVDDVLGNAGSVRSGQNSLNSSARQTPQPNLVNDILNQQQSSPVRSEHSGSARHTPQSNIINDYINEQRASPVRSEGSARQTPQADLFNDVLNRSTPVRSEHSGSARQTPQSSDLINDVLQQQRSSPARSEHSGSVYGSNRQTPQPQSEHSSARQTPTSHREMISDALRLSQERLYGSQGPQSHHSGSSRPQSLTSEQELSQYFEQNSRHSPERSSSKQTPTAKLPSTTERLSAHSTSSLPVITTQQRLQAEKRSMTPENHVRVPGAGSPVVRNSSAANRSAASSRASTRTLTPTSANGMMETGQKEEEHLQRIQDLEDSVRNLRKLLSSREMEVHELNKQLNDFKDLNKSLRKELEHVRSRKSPSSHYAELELKNKQLIEEKEILSAEVVKLQDQIDELRKGRVTILEGGRDGESSSIRHYQPNNPEALMKKIADLESHIQDLQEANESAMAEVTMSDRKLQMLLQENGNLKNTHGGSVADLEAENKRLHDKISKLYEEGYGDFDHKTRVETQQLRDDNRALRERNYKLHEENLKFKEELEQLRRALERTNVQSAPHRGELSSRMLSMGLASSRLEVERSYNTKLASDHKTSDKLSSRERVYKDDDRLMTSSLDRQDNRFRSSVEKDDHRYQPLDREPGRLKASDIYQRKDREYRSNLDKKDTKQSYDSYERLQPRLDQETEKSLLDRSFERMKYDYEELGGLRSDAYRPRPDGGSTVEKEQLSSSLKYEKSFDRPYDNDLLGFDNSKKDYYGRDYNLTDGSRRLSLDRDYKSSYEPRRESKSADRSKEMSMSETDLYGSGRGRTRSCSEMLKSTSSASYLPPPPPLQSVYHPSSYRSNLSYLPKPSFLWDDKEQRRPASSISDRVEPSQSSLGLSDRYSKTTPTPYTSSSYRNDDLFDRELSKSYKSHSKPPVVPSYTDDPGEVSDTATDILVNAQPFEKMSPPDTYSSQQYDDHHNRHSRHHSHYSEKHSTTQNKYDYRRRREMASAGSDSSPSDVEDQFGYSFHQRSKSADGRELRGTRTAPAGGMTRSNTGGRRDETTRLSLESGFRSVTPNILKTQHNKNLLTTTSGSLQNLTSGMRPFAPRSPGDINIEDVVKFSRQGGKLSQGEVKYIGHLPGRSDVYLGIELDKEDGKHDGKFEGNRYFRCKPNKGVFVAFNKVVMAWSPI